MCELYLTSGAVNIMHSYTLLCIVNETIVITRNNIIIICDRKLSVCLWSEKKKLINTYYNNILLCRINYLNGFRIKMNNLFMIFHGWNVFFSFLHAHACYRFIANASEPYLLLVRERYFTTVARLNDVTVLSCYRQ